MHPFDIKRIPSQAKLAMGGQHLKDELRQIIEEEKEWVEMISKNREGIIASHLGQR